MGTDKSTLRTEEYTLSPPKQKIANITNKKATPKSNDLCLSLDSAGKKLFIPLSRPIDQKKDTPFARKRKYSKSPISSCENPKCTSSTPTKIAEPSLNTCSIWYAVVVSVVIFRICDKIGCVV